jgi:vacuolar-type H+-ATPase subunit E/Vma4
MTRQEAAARAKLALADLERAAQNRQAEAEVALLAARQKALNEVSPAQVQARLVEALPEIVRHLPAPKELRTVAIGEGAGSGAQALAVLVAQLGGVLDAVRTPRSVPAEKA